MRPGPPASARCPAVRARTRSAVWLALTLCAAALSPSFGRAQDPGEPPALTALRQRLEARAAAPSATLAEPRMVDGALLPAGTVVRWTDAAQTRTYDARLPGPSPILGTVLVGGMYFDGFWIVRLAADAAVDGWPCSAASNVSILTSGKVLTCVLAAEARRPGVVVPAGSRVFPSWADGTWSFDVPGGVGLQIGPPGVVVQGVSDVSFNADGRIKRISARGGAALALRGVQFREPLAWVYPEAAGGQPDPAGIGARGRLARTVSGNGRRLPSGTEVILTFADGTLRRAP